MIVLFYRIANVDSSLCLPLFELRLDLKPSPSVMEMKWRLLYLPHTIAMPYQLQLQRSNSLVPRVRLWSHYERDKLPPDTS